MSDTKPLETECAGLPDLRRRLQGITEGVEVDLSEILDQAHSLEEVAVSLVRSLLSDEEAASRLEERMAELEEEFNGYDEQAEAKRKLALIILADAGIEHLVASGLTINIHRSCGSVVIVDEDLVPESFKIPRPGWVDYQKVHAALRQGTLVPGARLADSEPCLVVRSI